MIHVECLAWETCGSAYGTQFIVKVDLWTQHGNDKGRLCLPCFALRMGRKIRVEDLEAGPVMNLLAFRGVLSDLSPRVETLAQGR